MKQSPCPQNHPPGVSDTNDFGHVVKSHAAMVHATARRVTQDSALAEDVAQETFLALARQPHGALASVQAWLRRVAGRKAMDAVRGEARRRSNEAAAAALASGDTDDLPWTTLKPVISQLLNELPTPWKECLEQHYLEELTQQEIARRRGVSQATVSRYLDAGIRELKKMVRSKGLITGAALATVTSTQATSASSLPSASWSGSLAAGGTPSSASASTFSLAILPMKATKILVAVVVAAAIVLPTAFLLDRPKPPVKPAATKPVKAPPSSGFVGSQPAKAGSMATIQEDDVPDPVKPEMRSKVDALVQRFGGLTQEQLDVDPEFQKLRYRFFGNFSGAVPPRLIQAEDEMHAVLGPDKRAAGLSATMTIPPFGALEEPHNRTWLEVAVSGDHAQTMEWMAIQYERAAFEFLMDPTLKRSSNGVEIMKVPDQEAIAKSSTPEAKPDGE